MGSSALARGRGGGCRGHPSGAPPVSSLPGRPGLPLYLAVMFNSLSTTPGPPQYKLLGATWVLPALPAGGGGHAWGMSCLSEEGKEERGSWPLPTLEST